MGGFAIAFHRDGSPVEKSAVEKLLREIEHRGPNGRRSEIVGPLGLGHCAAHLLPEDANCKQPLRDPRSQHLLVFEGRLDNREELLRRFHLPSPSADAEIVLAAYEFWKEECPSHLYGDFILALYDERRQSLFCARDTTGVVPFYYYCSENLFLAGSEVGQLLTDSAVPRELDESAAAGFLATLSLGPEETLRRHIRKLPAAHWMRVTKNSFQLQKYWNIRDIESVQFANDADYSERLWELLLQAVECRWRSKHRVGIMLSGGLDSTAIAAAAVELRRSGRIPHEPVQAFSQVYPALDCDESLQIKATAASLGLSLQVFPFEGTPIEEYQRQVARHQDLPDSPNSACLNGMRASAFAQGTRVLLTGQGGDEWFTGSYYRYADLLRAGRVGELIRLGSVDAKLQGVSLAKFLWTNAFRPLTPSWAIAGYRLARGYQKVVPGYLDLDFALRHDLPRRLMPVLPGAFARASNYAQIRLVEEGDLASLLEYTDRVNASFGLSAVHPFLDRRLIEFALGIPERMCLSNGLSKYVLRQALNNRIPEFIRMRRDKADYSQLFVPPFQQIAASGVFSAMELVNRGWLKGEQIEKLVQQMLERSEQRDYSQSWHIWPLWNAYCLELLVRHEAARRGPGT